MPISNKKTIKTSYQRDESPGFLEKLGVKYYRYLAEKSGTADMQNISIDDLPPDITLQTLSSNITAFAAVIAFSIGALTTFVSIWIDWGVAIFAKACFGHPSPSKRQKLNATAYAFGAPDVLRTCHFATPS